jgi:hypothetical protein
MLRIVIVVRGGVVQAVLADSAKVKVELYDYDNEPDRHEPDEQEYPYVIL